MVSAVLFWVDVPWWKTIRYTHLHAHFQFRNQACNYTKFVKKNFLFIKVWKLFSKIHLKVIVSKSSLVASADSRIKEVGLNFWVKIWFVFSSLWSWKTSSGSREVNSTKNLSCWSSSTTKFILFWKNLHEKTAIKIVSRSGWSRPLSEIGANWAEW